MRLPGYKVQRARGYARTGPVWQVEDEAGDVFIAKLVNGSPALRGSLRVNGCVGIQQCIVLSPQCYAIIMDPVSGVPMASVVNVASEVVSKWITDLFIALNNLHRSGWVHGDISEANILVAAQRATLIDIEPDSAHLYTAKGAEKDLKALADIASARGIERGKQIKRVSQSHHTNQDHQNYKNYWGNQISQGGQSNQVNRNHQARYEVNTVNEIVREHMPTNEHTQLLEMPDVDAVRGALMLSELPETLDPDDYESYPRHKSSVSSSWWHTLTVIFAVLAVSVGGYLLISGVRTNNQRVDETIQDPADIQRRFSELVRDRDFALEQLSESNLEAVVTPGSLQAKADIALMQQLKDKGIHFVGLKTDILRIGVVKVVREKAEVQATLVNLEYKVCDRDEICKQFPERAPVRVHVVLGGSPLRISEVRTIADEMSS